MNLSHVKSLENLLTENALLPHKNLLFFNKIGIKKQCFQHQKHEKYLKSKNDIKRRLGHKLEKNAKYGNTTCGVGVGRCWWGVGSSLFT